MKLQKEMILLNQTDKTPEDVIKKKVGSSWLMLVVSILLM